MSFPDSKSRDIDPQDIDVVAAKYTDILTPGFAAAFTLDEAKEAGAFREDALSEADALESAGEAGHPEV